MILESAAELLVATGNAGKAGEIALLLAELNMRIRTLTEFPHVQEAEETGSTFAENAVIKALAYARQTNIWTLADDSGLEVDALGGAPGVRSARYAGEGASDAERIKRLLRDLGSTGDTDRRACFMCAVAVADPAAGRIHLWSGYCAGHIAAAPRGNNGFGYDPVFIPEGYDLTFGELPHEVKQRISHRAQALAEARLFFSGNTF